MNLTDRITEALKAHPWRKYGNPNGSRNWFPMCGCGESFRHMSYDQAFEAHRAHLAAVLVPLVEQAQAEAWAAGHHAGRHDAVMLTAGGDGALTPNPYRKDQP